MRVLVACEFSGIVRDAFLAKGHDAWSCDLLPCESESSRHLQGDVLPLLVEPWDLLIAHPPCTYLSYAAIGSWNRPGRAQLREEALQFFFALYNSPISRVAVENPVGWPNTVFRKPDQIIHPYYFGEPHVKRTCLWLKNLPLLRFEPNPIKPPPSGYYRRGPEKGKAYYFTDAMSFSPQRAHERSRTFVSIARAMAEQWGSL